MHAADRMATDKLKEGIEGFSAALVKLEGLLAKRLAELEPRTPATVCLYADFHSVRQSFRIHRRMREAPHIAARTLPALISFPRVDHTAAAARRPQVLAIARALLTNLMHPSVIDKFSDKLSVKADKQALARVSRLHLNLQAAGRCLTGVKAARAAMGGVYADSRLIRSNPFSSRLSATATKASSASTIRT